jgi:hypothetical protein
MAKQLLIYESAVPLSPSRHGKAWFEPSRDYGFSAHINSVPLMAVEFPPATAEYAIVFSAAGGDVLPMVVLGVRPDRNLYLSADLQWKAEYVPAFIRRYPFVFSTGAEVGTLTLCIDESYPGLNDEGRGVRLFGDDGRPGAQVQEVLRFLQDYHAQFERTKVFGNRLQSLGLLEPMRAEIKTLQGQALALGGFAVVSRARLRSLDGETLSQLAKSDELELIYQHLFSLRNFDRIRQSLVGSPASGIESAQTAAPAP